MTENKTGNRITMLGVNDVLISIDVETWGPIPGPNSMCNLGAVAYTQDKQRLGEFDANLADLEGSVRDDDTMNNFWLQPAQEETLTAITKDPQPAEDVMQRFCAWITEMVEAAAGAGVPGKPVLVAYPSGFDFMWVYWYWRRFLGTIPPFWFRCIDIKSFAAGKLNRSYNDCHKSTRRGGALVPYWPIDYPHTHKGVDDAEEQLWVYFNVRDGTVITPQESKN